MSDASTRIMIDAYMEEASAPLFLSGFFQSPPRNFHNTEKVEIDILRDDEDIAIAVQDLTVGGRENASTLYVNKAFTPTIFKEIGTITAFDLIKRHAGEPQFGDVDFNKNATLEAFRIARKLELKIRRSIELMAAQVLQTGKVTLKDSAGLDVYLLDFLAKSSHHVTVGIPWAADGSTGDPFADISALGTVVRRNGKQVPNRLVFGAGAARRFRVSNAVQSQLDKININIGRIAPESRGQGATFMGYIWCDHYEYEMWMYDGYYRDPQTNSFLPYVADDKVLMSCTKGRLDLSWGAIPRLVAPDPRALAFLPARMSSGERGLDLSMHPWFTPDGTQLKLNVGARPLTIPTAIDTFGTLDVF